MCEHEKEYHNDLILLSLPAKIPWKCSKCGEVGYKIERDSNALKRIRDEMDLNLKKD